ncbi:MAG: hypothetical protein HND58_00450 [Planctomycetota bacterium]|nr:MAG: hypothetical protein HND58_00450 [Planctomycetota bacterium]
MSEEAATSGGLIAGLSGLQKLCLALAAVISISGAGLWGVGATTAGDRAETAATEASGADDSGGSEFSPQGFTDSSTSGEDDVESRGTDTGEDAEKSPLELYSPTIFRLGFAFFLGFAVAFALRAAFKVVLLVVGGVFLLLIGLQMAGLVSVNWEAFEGMYNTSTKWLAGQTESFTAFLRGYIPSGGSAVAGFGIGMLKKH